MTVQPRLPCELLSADHPNRPESHQYFSVVVVLHQISKSSTLLLILAEYFIWKIWGAPPKHNLSLVLGPVRKSTGPFEYTFENTQWGKDKQMQPVWICIHSGWSFADTFENTQWRKVANMQPMQLFIWSGRRFEITFENAQWRKVKEMQAMWLCLFSDS